MKKKKKTLLKGSLVSSRPRPDGDGDGRHGRQEGVRLVNQAVVSRPPGVTVVHTKSEHSQAPSAPFALKAGVLN